MDRGIVANPEPPGINPSNPEASASSITVNKTLTQVSLVKRDEVNPPVDYPNNYNHFAGARFIIECGIKLKASVLTIATAAHYYHKFFASASLEDYDPYQIGSTCIYLASKVEDDDIKIRDIINVGISCVRRGEPALSLEPYFAMRDSVIQAELLLMRVLQFKLKVDLPHRYLLHYLKSLEDWLGEDTFRSIPIVQLAWTIIQDIYHSDIVLHYSPQLIAATIINLTLQVYGVVVPGCDEINDHPWYSVLHPDCSAKNVWDLQTKIIHIFKQENDLVFVK